ncbi:hypothetical protein PG988_007232 [Apiospora saccharicola]
MESMESQEGSLTSESPTWSTSDSSDDLTDSESGFNALDNLLGVLDLDDYPRITGLCKHLWPSMIEDTIKFECYFDGDNNRQLALWFSEYGEGGSAQVIQHELLLRIPVKQTSIPRTVAILQYLEKYTGISAPRVVKWDVTKDNPLGVGYLLVTNFSGDTYDYYEPDLSHDQRIVFAKQLAALYRQMESITSPVAGIIEARLSTVNSSICSTPDEPICVRAFGTECCIQVEDRDTGWDGEVEDVDKLLHNLLCRDPPGLTVADAMLRIYQRHMHYSPECRKEGHDHSLELLELLQEKMQELVDLKIFGSNKICLQRPDLFDRNIMVEIDADGNPVLTAVVDWDDALFVPRFAAREPPRWLWGQYDLKYYGGSLKKGESILSTPSTLLTAMTPENEDIKRAFTEAIGEDWMAEAEDERLALVRALLHFSREVVCPDPSKPPVARKAVWEAFLKGSSTTTHPRIQEPIHPCPHIALMEADGEIDIFAPGHIYAPPPLRQAQQQKDATPNTIWCAYCTDIIDEDTE